MPNFDTLADTIRPYLNEKARECLDSPTTGHRALASYWDDIDGDGHLEISGQFTYSRNPVTLDLSDE